jgi:hypothetical protein
MTLINHEDSPTWDWSADSDDKEDNYVRSAGILHRLIGIESMFGFHIAGQSSFAKKITRT